MKIQSLSFLFVVGIAFLSMGTVLKKKDPIVETQTDPVGYSEKAKEEAQGKKGPPVPRLELYPKERFLVEGPVEKKKGVPSEPEETEIDLWLEEEGMEEGEIGEEEGLWDEGEEGEEFKLPAKRDDTRKKSAKGETGFLDTEKA